MNHFHFRNYVHFVYVTGISNSSFAMLHRTYFPILVDIIKMEIDYFEIRNFDTIQTQFKYLHNECDSSVYYVTFREFQQNSSTATIILASKPHSSTTKTPPMFLTLSGLALESLLLS